MSYQTIRVRFDSDICFLQLYRPDAKNTINDLMIEECTLALKACEGTAKIVVVEGLEDIFCFGADFQAMASADYGNHFSPEPLYDLWLQLALGPFISIAHVRGQANAGGIGFIAACDLVFADNRAVFSLSELLFGLMPACVLPFLIRKIGFQKAHALTLMTKPVGVSEVFAWGLVDAYDQDSVTLLRKQLVRLKCINKIATTRYKRYVNSLNPCLATSKEKALAANMAVVNDLDNVQKISRYVETGKFPWE